MISIKIGGEVTKKVFALLTIFLLGFGSLIIFSLVCVNVVNDSLFNMFMTMTPAIKVAMIFIVMVFLWVVYLVCRKQN